MSSLSFGTMTLGGTGSLASIGSSDIVAAARQIDMCLDAGINLFDTANTYGQSEKVLGGIIATRRERMVIATKCRFPVGPGPNDEGLSRHHIIDQCDKSLSRLGVEHIDLYQMHGWDGQVPLEETLEAFTTLLRSGKVRYAGVSNLAGWQLMKMLRIAEAKGLSRPVVQQIYYNLMAREAEYELMPIAIDQGVGMLVWSPLAGGILSGKYRNGSSAAVARGGSAGWQGPPINDPAKLETTLDALHEIAIAHDARPAQIALAWLLHRPAISSVIIGARDAEQLKMNMMAATIRLRTEDLVRLDAASRPADLYPYWHHARHGGDRLSPADVVPLAILGRT